MHLFCTTKGCAHVIERPERDKGRGWLLVHCVRCKKTSDHCPCPPPGKLLPVKPFGHLRRATA